MIKSYSFPEYGVSYTETLDDAHLYLVSVVLKDQQPNSQGTLNAIGHLVPASSDAEAWLIGAKYGRVLDVVSYMEMMRVFAERVLKDGGIVECIPPISKT